MWQCSYDRVFILFSQTGFQTRFYPLPLGHIFSHFFVTSSLPRKSQGKTGQTGLTSFAPDWRTLLLKSARRMSSVVIRSMAGRTFKLSQLVECADIPQDKREIVTAEMAKQFPHLKEIAEEIPPYDPKAKIEILIGRDALSYWRSEQARTALKEPRGRSNLT